MSLVSGYSHSLFAPLHSSGVSGKQNSLFQTNGRMDAARTVAQPPAAGLTGAAPGNIQANTLFAAHSLAQDDGAVQAAATGKPSAKDDFLAYQQMSTTEKMRAMVLGEMGMTEEELEALPPEEREKIEEKIRARIKELIEEDVRENLQDTLIP